MSIFLRLKTVDVRQSKQKNVICLINQEYTDLWILDIDPGGVLVIFAKEQEKIWKIISFGNNFEEKEKNLGLGQKYEINYA